MDQAAIDDLKQFITTAIRSEVSVIFEEKLEEKLEQKLEQKLAPIHQRIDDLDVKLDTVVQAIGDTMTEKHETVDSQLHNHEQRITALGHAAA